MSNYDNYEEAKERIEVYFKEYMSDISNDGQLNDYVKETLPSIVELLMPYALENNYWWEEKSVKMAYYQMRLNDFVVDYNDFTRYYEKLMGKKYDPIDFSTSVKRKEMFEEATVKYNKLNNKRAR